MPEEGEIRLGDGRRLAFCEYGARAGAPAFFFHGWPGSRPDFAANEAAAASAGARVIAVDRPGIGRSDPLNGRSVMDWPGDVARLADSIGIERFAVFGHSFGGPYVRACALPERVARAGLVSCIGPIDPVALRGMPAATRWALEAARRSALLARPMVWLTARQALRGKLIARLASSMCAADAELLGRREVAEALGDGVAECFRQGSGPPTWDGVAVARGEGVPLEQVSPEVLIWHGEEDRSVPVAMARDQERRLPRVKARYYESEGHLILFSRIGEILAALVAT